MQTKNAWLHFKKICKHKYLVGKYCFKMGLYWQGIMHDMSKFSPIEFFESAKYYQGNKSPIDECKKINGLSYGWQHHKGRNPHHYEYFVDNLDLGGTAIQMPFKYAAELICDYLGAGRAYMGENFSYEAEYKWWLNKSSNPLLMHPQTKEFINITLYNLSLATNPNLLLNKKTLLNYYKLAQKSVKI